MNAHPLLLLDASALTSPAGFLQRSWRTQLTLTPCTRVVFVSARRHTSGAHSCTALPVTCFKEQTAAEQTQIHGSFCFCDPGSLEPQCLMSGYLERPQGKASRRGRGLAVTRLWSRARTPVRSGEGPLTQLSPGHAAEGWSPPCRINTVVF